MENRFIVGLTGQSGAGKTTVSRMFEENGFFVVDCDKLSRKVTESGSDCCKKLAEHFPDCFDESYTLDRRRLGNEVFGCEEKLKLLNELIFPFITEEAQKQISLCGQRLVLLDAPTLFEAGMDSICSMIVSVTADEDIRVKRILERDSLTEEQALRRFSSQRTQGFFEENSDIVIENNGSDVRLRNAALQAIQKIKETADAK